MNRCTAAIAVVILTAIAPVEAQNATASLQIRETRFTPAGELECVVVNTGTQSITAWSFAFLARTDGRLTPNSRITTDLYIQDAHRASRPEGVNFIRPGQVTTIALGPGRSADVEVALVAIVFEDGTAERDPAQLASVFEARAAERNVRRHASTKPGSGTRRAGESPRVRDT